MTESQPGKGIEQVKRLHVTVSFNRTSPEGRHAKAFGVRFGYWPCLRAPFISLSVGKRLIDIWVGLPSYLNTAHRAWQWPL